MSTLVVDIADCRVASSPSSEIVTYALGSCIAVMLVDPAAHVGGLLHFMLPDSSIDSRKASDSPFMFADTGIPLLLRMVSRLNPDPKRLVAYLAGGSNMMDPDNFFSIGNRNIAAAHVLLRKAEVPIRSESVGGIVTRSVGLRLENGSVWLKQQRSSGPPAAQPAGVGRGPGA